MRGSGDNQLVVGRDALRRHAWHEAFEQLSAADAAEPLPPEDLELLAQAAWWVGRLDGCIAVHERAHAVYPSAVIGAVPVTWLSFSATTTSPRGRAPRRTGG
jgi:hypothetical protein